MYENKRLSIAELIFSILLIICGVFTLTRPAAAIGGATIVYGILAIATGVMDIVIYAAFAVIFNEFEGAMYALIAMFVVTRVIDLVLYGLGTSKVCYIISDESDKLKNAITATLGRGVTLLHGEGAYTGKAKNVILCVIKKHQIMDVRRIIKSIDTHAFLIVTEAKNVYGNGFGDISEEN